MIENVAIDMLNTMLSVAEVADMLHVHPSTLRRWSNAGLINSYRISSRGDRRYVLADVQDFVKKMNESGFIMVAAPDQGTRA